METRENQPETTTNGAALAAFLAAGIGAFAVGLFVVLNETGLYAAPALYGPAGGVTGRTAFAVAVWLIAWAVLHSRWKSKEIGRRRIQTVTLVLILLALVLTFPPAWSLL
jgi:hypothetical protein